MLDYKLIRDLSEWTGSSDRLSVDIRYYVCRDDSGQVVPAETVIGKPGVTFSMHIPRVALYSTFWKMKNTEKLMELSQPYGVSGSPPRERPRRTSKVQECHRAIVALGKDDQLELKRLLVQA